TGQLWAQEALSGNQAPAVSSTTSRPTLAVGCVMGFGPQSLNAHIFRLRQALVGDVRPEIDPRWEASPEAVGRADQAPALGIEGPQHCVGDGGGTVAATEFARGEARGKGAVDRAFDRARGGSGTAQARAFGQPRGDQA